MPHQLPPGTVVVALSYKSVKTNLPWFQVTLNLMQDRFILNILYLVSLVNKL